MTSLKALPYTGPLTSSSATTMGFPSLSERLPPPLRRCTLTPSKSSNCGSFTSTTSTPYLKSHTSPRFSLRFCRQPRTWTRFPRISKPSCSGCMLWRLLRWKRDMPRVCSANLNNSFSLGICRPLSRRWSTPNLCASMILLYSKHSSSIWSGAPPIYCCYPPLTSCSLLYDGL